MRRAVRCRVLELGEDTRLVFHRDADPLRHWVRDTGYAMNSPHDYWLSPSAELIRATPDHHRKARELGGTGGSPSDCLLQRGWCRVVGCLEISNLFFERRSVPTEKQMARLKDLAIELDCKLDDGQRVIYDPSDKECVF